MKQASKFFSCFFFHGNLNAFFRDHLAYLECQYAHANKINIYTFLNTLITMVPEYVPKKYTKF